MANEPQMKTCTKCGSVKPVSEFHSAGQGYFRSRCKACVSEAGLTRSPEERARVAAAARRRHAENPAPRRASVTRWNKNHPEQAKHMKWRGHLKRMYNLSLERYDAMVNEQRGVCALCGAAPKIGARLNVDHDHDCCPRKGCCGRCVRGLICARCNRLLGWFDKNRQAILAYTERK